MTVVLNAALSSWWLLQGTIVNIGRKSKSRGTSILSESRSLLSAFNRRFGILGYTMMVSLVKYLNEFWITDDRHMTHRTQTQMNNFTFFVNVHEIIKLIQLQQYHYCSPASDHLSLYPRLDASIGEVLVRLPWQAYMFFVFDVTPHMSYVIIIVPIWDCNLRSFSDDMYHW